MAKTETKENYVIDLLILSSIDVIENEVFLY